MICKSINGGFSIDESGKFYINYVICKSNSYYAIGAEHGSFILTMWYVNYVH